MSNNNNYYLKIMAQANTPEKWKYVPSKILPPKFVIILY